MDKLLGLLNQGDQKQSHRSTYEISNEMDLTQCSIVQIIYCDLCRKCFVVYQMCLLPIASFSYGTRIFYKVV